MGHDLYSRQVCKSPGHPCPQSELVDGLAFVGQSAAIERLRVQVRRVAPHLRIALITGERGTGKQQVARALHSLSGKDAATFQILQTAIELHEPRASHIPHQIRSQISKRRPTYYLPNLSSLTPRHQAELLASIHSLEAATPAGKRPHLIFSSTDDLRGLVAAGQFHPELYRKISSVEITLTPLRSRPEDIAEVAVSLLGRPTGTYQNGSFANGLTANGLTSNGLTSNGLTANGLTANESSAPGALFDGRALSRLKAYGWPGNLRELVRVIALAARHAGPGTIEAMHLPPLEAAPSARTSQAAAEPETERLDEVIERHVLGVLLRCAGNKVRAAERLGISRSTLYRMLETSPSTSSIHQAHNYASGPPQAVETVSPTLHP